MSTDTFNIYCDESCHLLNDGIKPMLIGAIWCPIDKKDIIFKRLREIKVRNGFKPYWELKWNAVSPRRIGYYEDVINYFFDNPDIHYRVLIVRDKSDLDHAAHHQTHDQFYYKMYFDMLKVILTPSKKYNIYMDIKDTHSCKNVLNLKEYLCNVKYDFDKKMINNMQPVASSEIELIQLSDLLTGAVGYHVRELSSSNAKIKLVKMIQQLSGYSLNESTLLREDKFNIFFWEGGHRNGNID